MTRPDPREVFLARAAARDHLVREGEMTIDRAFGELAPVFWEIVGHCKCAREIINRLSKPLPRERRRRAAA
jgi:hypothetical protein